MRKVFVILFLFVSFNLFSATPDEVEKLYECFSIKDIKINSEYEQIQWSPNKKLQDVCIFSFHVTSDNVNRIYLTRRWRSPAYCKKFMSEWRGLERDDKKVCIAGYISHPEKKKIKGKEILEAIGYWEAVKSGDWCHTYFIGNCKGVPASTESF